MKLNLPHDVKIGPDGSLYIADGTRIRRVTPEPERIITTIAGDGQAFVGGADGDVAFGSGIGGVQTIAVGGDGSVYFPSSAREPNPPPSTSFERIRRIGVDGRFSTVAGKPGPSAPVLGGDGGQATDAQLIQPRGISIGPDGTLYFVDGNGTRVRRVAPDGIITTVVGTGVNDFSGDDGPAGLAKINQARGTTVGPDGTLYVGDSFNGRHRRVSKVLPGISSSNYLIPSEDGREVYEFGPDGRHLNTRDAFTGATLFTFAHTDGLLTSITDRSGNVTAINRTLGVPTSIQASGGQTTTLGLTGGYLTTSTNPASEATQLTYVADGLLRTFTDPRGAGHTSTYTYDGNGRLVRDDDPTVSPFKELARVFQEPSATALFGYRVDVTSAMGRVYKYLFEKLPSGTKRRTNTSPALLQRVTTEGPNETHTMSHPDGTQAAWRMAPETGRFGMQMPLWTDLSISTPAMRAAMPPQAATLTQTRSVTLSMPGDVFSLASFTETSTINGRTSQRTYDPVARKFTDTSAEGRKRFTTLDAAGRVSSVQLEGLEAVRFEYDSPRGRLEKIRQGTGGAERVYTLAYNALNQLTDLTNPMPAPFEVTSFGDDAADRVTSQTLPDASEIGFGYDDNGNLTSLTPPGKPAHGFSYTATNLEATYAPPMPTPALAAPQTQYAYNPDRQLDLVTRPHVEPTPLPADVQVDYVYESGTDRLSKIALPADEGEIAFAYDATTGQLAKVTGPDPAGAPNPRTMTLAHDGFLELSTTWGCETPPCPAATIQGSVSREYDTSLRVVMQKVNDADPVTFGYDDDDLLTSVTLGGETLTLTRDNATQKAGLITATALGGVTDTRTYNEFGELTSLVSVYNGTTPLYSVQYPNRDKLGRITEKIETIARAGGGTDSYTTTYTYDEVGRLETVNVTGDATYSATYAYDANGNRTAAPNLSGPAVYDPQDRLLQYGTNGPAYDYTANGELQTKTTSTEVTDYEYDAVGNLRKVTITPSGGPATEIEYVVDGLGRRIGRKVGGTLQQGFLYDDQLKILAELDGSNTVVSRFAYGTQVNVPEFMRRGGQTYRLITDHLGSVRLVVNLADGSIAQRIDYDEFGNATLAGGTWAVQPFGLARGVSDTDTGTIHLGARDYSPTDGRWTSQDPIGFPDDGTNRYDYVRGDPVNRADASGLGEVYPFPPGGRGFRQPYLGPPIPGRPGKVYPIRPPPAPFLPIEPIPLILPVPLLCALPQAHVTYPDLCPPPCT